MTQRDLHIAARTHRNIHASSTILGRRRHGARCTAVVVGASLAGLMSALTLSRIGWKVTVPERSGRKSRTGAALEVREGLLERLTGRHASAGMSSLPAGAQSWAEIHAGLLEAARADGNIDIRSPVRVVRVEQDATSGWVATEGGEIVRGDIVVGADGHASVVRRHVAPNEPDARFAGYMIWLGLVDEGAIRSKPWPSQLAILYERDYCLNAYYLPGANGDLTVGKRRLGWGWYDAGRNHLLRQSGALVGEVVRQTLRRDQIPNAVFKELAAEALAIWPQPWREAILDCIARRDVIGTPVAEYLPNCLSHGRVCLVGDAAHVPSPMTGSGFAASALDAMALAEALDSGAAGTSVTEALCLYEAKRMEAARDLVRSGQSFSRSFVRERAAT